MPILFDKIVTAKQCHRCDQCLGPIKTGERYRKQVHTEDGFQVYKAHEDCDECASEIHAICAMLPDEYVRLSDDLGEEWTKEHFPTVYERLIAR